MKSYDKVIFVANNGTCREPMAAEILKDVGLKRPIEILARGLIVLFPEPLNQKAEAVMISNGLNTEGYMSAPLCGRDFTENTLVLVMESKHRQKVLEIFQELNPEDIWVLTELVGDELEILDPYGGTLQSYGLCYETLCKSIKKLANIFIGN